MTGLHGRLTKRCRREVKRWKKRQKNLEQLKARRDCKNGDHVDSNDLKLSVAECKCEYRSFPYTFSM